MSNTQPPEADLIRIRHMVDAAREAAAFIAGRERADLDADRMLVRALMHCIAEIGEAANRLSGGARSELAAVPWRDVVAMRNRMIHVYWDINLDILWATVTRDLPHLLSVLDPWISERGPADTA